MMTDEVATKVVMPKLSAVSVDEEAESAVNAALEFSAQKLGRPVKTVVARIQEGDGVAASYWRYGLAKRMAECLADWDESVKAVYAVDYDATPDDLAFGTATQPVLVHLIAWVDRKTAALDSLVAALDGALVQRVAELMGMDRLAHLLDVQVVDDEDVESRRGYGAALTSLHNSPIQVWTR
jgi:ribosomal protein L35AE/L33A